MPSGSLAFRLGAPYPSRHRAMTFFGPMRKVWRGSRPHRRDASNVEGEGSSLEDRGSILQSGSLFGDERLAGCETGVTRGVRRSCRNDHECLVTRDACRPVGRSGSQGVRRQSSVAPRSVMLASHFGGAKAEPSASFIAVSTRYDSSFADFVSRHQRCGRADRRARPKRQERSPDEARSPASRRKGCSPSPTRQTRSWTKVTSLERCSTRNQVRRLSRRAVVPRPRAEEPTGEGSQDRLFRIGVRSSQTSRGHGAPAVNIDAWAFFSRRCL